jgi:hypothetical protein
LSAIVTPDFATLQLCKPGSPGLQTRYVKGLNIRASGFLTSPVKILPDGKIIPLALASRADHGAVATVKR